MLSLVAIVIQPYPNKCYNYVVRILAPMYVHLLQVYTGSYRLQNTTTRNVILVM